MVQSQEGKIVWCYIGLGIETKNMFLYPAVSMFICNVKSVRTAGAPGGR